jgi:hypothetical protein
MYGYVYIFIHEAFAVSIVAYVYISIKLAFAVSISYIYIYVCVCIIYIVLYLYTVYCVSVVGFEQLKAWISGSQPGRFWGFGAQTLAAMAIELLTWSNSNRERKSNYHQQVDNVTINS